MPDGKRLFFFCQFYNLISAFVALLSVKLFLAVWGENVTFFTQQTKLSVSAGETKNINCKSDTLKL